MMIQHKVVIQTFLKTFQISHCLFFELFFSCIFISDPEHSCPETICPVIIFLDSVVSICCTCGRKFIPEFLHIFLQDCTASVEFLPDPGCMLLLHYFFHIFDLLLPLSQKEKSADPRSFHRFLEEFFDRCLRIIRYHLCCHMNSCF